jgi:hypothetical protein
MNACNAGEYSKAKTFYTASMQKIIDGDLGAMAGGMKGACDQFTKNGTLASVTITSETIRGEGAIVIADVVFKDGTSKKGDETELVKENGAWKVAK